MYEKIADKYLHDGTNYVKVFKKKLKPVNDSEFVKYISSEHIPNSTRW